MTDEIAICGAGPAGLAAAIAVARGGGRAVLYERRAAADSRFHGDLQGLENWTRPGDVLDELTALGVAVSFDAVPVRELVVFDPKGRVYPCRAAQPLFYLVRRGRGAGTLDTALRAQAEAAGVDVRYGREAPALGRGIMATGPRGGNIIAVGYVFETDAADGVYAAASDELAPKGYAYLLICRGRGTLATCLYRDFPGQRLYLERTLDFFKARVGFSMREVRRFGGAGRYAFPDQARRGELLYVGEAAGFQDAMFGFGIRYAVCSAVLAVRSLMAGRPADYDRLWRRQLQGHFRTAVVNRYFYERLGNAGYGGFLRGVSVAGDTRDWLRRYYGPSWLKALWYPVARRRISLAQPLRRGSA